MNEEIMYHIGLSTSVRAKYAILPGDPGRVPKIAAYLDDPRELGFNREFRTFSGKLCGETVLVTSTGIGGPSAAIAVEELIRLGVDTFVRVGTCGGMNEKACAGDVVIATGAIRMEGTSREYLPIEFPAVADFGLVRQRLSDCRITPAWCRARIPSTGSIPRRACQTARSCSASGTRGSQEVVWRPRWRRLRFSRLRRQETSAPRRSSMLSGTRRVATGSGMIPNRMTRIALSERRLRD